MHACTHTDCTYHVYLALVLLKSDAEQKGKKQFMFLKQTPADVAIEAERKIVVNVVIAYSYRESVLKRSDSDPTYGKRLVYNL